LRSFLTPTRELQGMSSTFFFCNPPPAICILNDCRAEIFYHKRVNFKKSVRSIEPSTLSV
jgi:hypothetical protein